MAYLSFWMDHRSRELHHLRHLARFLCEPIFDKIDRSAMIDRDKRVGRRAKTVAAIEEQLRADRSQGVDLDQRGNEVDAHAFFVFKKSSDRPYPAPHSGYVYIPYQPEQLEDFLGAVKRIFTELDGVLGYISLEPSSREALSVCLGTDTRVTRARDDISDQRRRERKAQSRSLRQYPTRLPAVHWGMFLSAGHLETVGVATLKASPGFHRVDSLKETLVFIQLTNDPMDALSSRYDQLLDAAREVLAPLLIDVSGIELEPRHPVE